MAFARVGLNQKKEKTLPMGWAWNRPASIKLAVAILAVVAVSGMPGRSWALFGEEDWFSGQNQLLVQLLATEAGEAADLASLLANIRMVTEATNEGLALARSSYRAYQAVRNYSIEDLMSDAKEGLYDAFPDLRAIEENGDLLHEQWDERSHFFSYRNRFDAQISPLARKLFEHSYQATIWPAVFPNAMGMKANFTPVELMIWERYMKTQQGLEVLVKKTSLAALAKKVQNLVKDAEESKNMELAAQAMETQLTTQLVNDVSEITDLMKSSLALEEQDREAERQRRQSIRKGLSKDFSLMLMPGGGMTELREDGE
jgi:hypothetical protein